jgi:hypothetical protein
MKFGGWDADWLISCAVAFDESQTESTPKTTAHFSEDAEYLGKDVDSTGS